ncbi:MAG: hypothetical protein IMW94_04235 [Thermoanaerobacter sp.]|nr:hypothetical protein [Thermoanaerobacter sp.]
MCRTIFNFLRDERSGMSAASYTTVAAAGVCGLAVLHGLHHHAWHLVPDPGGGFLDAAATTAAAVPVGVGAVKKGWEWDCGGRVLYVSRDLARDRNMFRVPPEGYQKEANIHTGEIQDVVTWRWPGDDRVFLVPIELFQAASLGGMIRDIISATGQIYRDQHFPEDRIITTSFRKIADVIGLEFNGRVADELETCLAYARSFTVYNHPVISQLNKDGTVKKRSKVTFGFVDCVARVDILDGKPVPKNRAPIEITISNLYATALKELPPAPLPCAALEAAHKAPRKLRPAIKNIAYFLAARVPSKKIKLLIPTILEVMGYGRKDGRIDRCRKPIENVLSKLYSIMIEDYNYTNDGYEIILAGNPIYDNKRVRRYKDKNET